MAEEAEEKRIAKEEEDTRSRRQKKEFDGTSGEGKEPDVEATPPTSGNCKGK